MGDCLAWLWWPCWAGIHQPNQEDPEARNHRQQDGSISATLVVLIFFGMGITLSVARWITSAQSIPIDRPYCEIVLSIFMLCGCGMMLTFGTCSFGETRTDSDSLDPSGRDVSRFFAKHLSFIGLVVFFVFAFFLDALPLAAYLQCIETFVDCNLGFQYIMRIIFLLVRVIFKFMLLFFTYIFDSRNFRQSMLVRYGIGVILLAILCNWWDYVVFDIHRVYGYADIRKTCIVKNENDSLEAQCSNKNTSIYKLFNEVAKYLYPMDTEFSLLAAKIIFHMTWNAKSFERRAESVSRNIDEESPLLHVNPPDGVLVPPNTPAPEPIPMNPHGSPIKFPFFVSMALVLNLFILVTGALALIDEPISDMIFRLIMWLAMLVSSGVGTQLLTRNFKSVYHEYSGLDLLTVASLLGASMHLWLLLYAAVACAMGTHQDGHQPCRQIKDANVAFPADISDVFLNFLQLFYQTAFMMHASRVHADFNGDVEENSRIAKKLWWLRQIELFLAITNLTLWVNDSLVETNSKGMHAIQEDYYGDAWIPLMHITIPFFLFFRFNSFLILMYSFFKHSNPSNSFA